LPSSITPKATAIMIGSESRANACRRGMLSLITLG
jgi:hypothetical protein